MLKPIAFDRAQARAGFDRRTDPATRADFLLAEIESRLFERIEPIRLTPARILDLGCGLGRGLPGLLARYPRAECIAADFSLPTLRAASIRARDHLHAGRRMRGWLERIGIERVGAAVASGRNHPEPSWLCCDAQSLPLADGSIDLVWSNLVAHWFDDPLAAIGEWYRVSRPGGLLMFSAFGVDTLRELPATPDESTPVFQDMHDWGDALTTAGFADPVMEVERLKLEFTDHDALARDLDGLFVGMRMAPPSKADSAPIRTLTIEITYGHAWCPAEKRRSDGFSPLRFQPRA